MHLVLACHQVLINNRKIFNNILSRGRKSVERFFGKLAAKFGVLKTLIKCNPYTVHTLVQAMCVLHNAIRKCYGMFSKLHYENVIISKSIIETYVRGMSLSDIRSVCMRP